MALLAGALCSPSCSNSELLVDDAPSGPSSSSSSAWSRTPTVATVLCADALGPAESEPSVPRDVRSVRPSISHTPREINR